MEGIELLFILLFLLFPLLEGIARKRRQPGPPKGRPGEDQEARGDASTTLDAEVDRSRRAPEPAQASDMLPDDLWELLTGERRTAREPPAGSPAETSSRTFEEPEWVSADGGVATEAPDEELEAWNAPSYDEAADTGPLSLEYVGLEAHSLERPTPLEPPRVSRLYQVSEPVPVPPRRRSPLTRTLRRHGGLREAVIMAEILGPPRGLD